MRGAIPALLQYALIAWCLVKHRDNFTFTCIWRLHIEMTEDMTFRTYIRVYSLFTCDRLSANIKLTLHKAIITSVMNYDSPAWEFSACKTRFSSLITSQGVHRPANFMMRLSTFRTFMTYFTKLCSQQARVIQNHAIATVHNIGQGEAMHRKYNRRTLWRSGLRPFS
jgi:hypothetical protein